MTDHDEERGALNALTREAHEAITDLNALLKTVDARLVSAAKLVEEFDAAAANFKVNVDSYMAAEMCSRMDEVAVEQVKGFQETMLAAVKQSEVNIFKRFDDLFDNMVPTAFQTDPMADVSALISKRLKEKGY